MKKDLIKIIISIILFAIALLVPFQNIWITRGIFIVSYIIVAYEVLIEAIEHIFKGKIFDENFLMSVATIGAFAIGEFPEAVAVMLFYKIGELFEEYANNKSRKSISDLMDIRPDFANVLRNGQEEKINPEEVNIGDVILIKPGEKIPLDGKVIKGTSMLDTKALTGETIPRKVEIGDEVLSGCINQDGILELEVIKEYGESTVSKILDLVENANNKKSKSEKFITKFASVYTPVVVVIAVLLAIIPPLVIKGAMFSDWIYRALAFLVVACPCALVISIPLSFFGGIGGASKHGILIKGSNYLEALSKTETVVFDKTGTLTKGIFEVQKVNTINMTQDELLEIVAVAEQHSNHPIAKSIRQAYGKPIDKVIDFKELSGKGICSKFDGKEVLIGNETLMIETGIKYTKCEEAGTALYIAVNNDFEGYILIADKIKEDSKKTIEDLKKQGIKEIVMLTGDKKEIAEDISSKIGIDKVYSELLPDGKTQKVEELLKNKSEKGSLAFVGDGINDAPVLALSDIGIAMGGIGSDSAIEAADVVIMTDEPSKIGAAIKISRKTMKVVKENIVFAICVKILVLILSALGIATMWGAVFADVGVTIIVIINALRMLMKVSDKF